MLPRCFQVSKEGNKKIQKLRLSENEKELLEEIKKIFLYRPQNKFPKSFAEKLKGQKIFCESGFTFVPMRFKKGRLRVIGQYCYKTPWGDFPCFDDKLEEESFTVEVVDRRGDNTYS